MIHQTGTAQDGIDRALLGRAARESCGCSRPTGRVCPCCHRIPVYLHMHLLVELHGQPGWAAALTPVSVDMMIVAASMTLLAESRAGGGGGFLPWQCW